MNGVRRCVVGYSGGTRPNPTYENIMDYTEAILVEYDPKIVSYRQILQKWRKLGEPYPAKRQYRSAIFCLNAEQEAIASDFCDGLEFVDIEPVTKFYMAEERHQNFLARMGGR